MNRTALILGLLLLGAVTMAEEQRVWVGAYVWGKANAESPGYWMGQMEIKQFDEVISGLRKDGFFRLSYTCWYDMDDNNRVIAIKDCADDYENGVTYFRIDKLDRLFMLNGDPRLVFKSKENATTVP